MRPGLIGLETLRSVFSSFHPDGQREPPFPAVQFSLLLHEGVEPLPWYSQWLALVVVQHQFVRVGGLTSGLLLSQ